MKTKRETKLHELTRRLKYNKSALFGLIILFIIVLCALFADYIAPNDPIPSPPQLANKLKPGFWSEKGLEGTPLGTDGLGRCVLSRIIYGSRISLSAGFVAVGIAMILGITFGVMAGYYGGWIDSLIMRIVDVMFAFPALNALKPALSGQFTRMKIATSLSSAICAGETRSALRSVPWEP